MFGCEYDSSRITNANSSVNMTYIYSCQHLPSYKTVFTLELIDIVSGGWDQSSKRPACQETGRELFVEI